MAIEVEVPDVGIVEFPDDTAPDRIKSILAKKYSKQAAVPVPMIQPGQSVPGLEQYTNGAIPLKSYSEFTSKDILASPPAIRELALSSGAGLSIPAQPVREARALEKVALFLNQTDELSKQRVGKVLESSLQEPLPVPSIGQDIVKAGTQGAFNDAVTKLGLDSQTVADAVDVLSGKINEKRRTPSAVEKVFAGGQSAVTDALNFFTSPLGVATLGTGSLPAGAQRAVAGAFTAQMAASVPEQVNALIAAVKSGDWEAGSKAAVGLGLTGVFIKQGAEHALGKTKPTTERTQDVIQQKAQETPGVLKEQAAPGAGGRLEELKAIEKPTPEQIAERDVLQKKSDSVKNSDLMKKQLAELRAKQAEIDKGNADPVAKLEKQLETPEELANGNDLSKDAGLALTSVEQFDKLAETVRKYGAERDRLLDLARKADAVGDREAAANYSTQSGVPQKKAQLARETIETAANVGSNAESLGGLFEMGKRPLDWRENAKVSEWLQKNGAELKINISELKTSAPPPRESAVENLPKAEQEKLNQGEGRKYATESKLTEADIPRLEELKKKHDAAFKASGYTDNAAQALAEFYYGARSVIINNRETKASATKPSEANRILTKSVQETPQQFEARTEHFRKTGEVLPPPEIIPDTPQGAAQPERLPKNPVAPVAGEKPQKGNVTIKVPNPYGLAPEGEKILTVTGNAVKIDSVPEFDFVAYKTGKGWRVVEKTTGLAPGSSYGKTKSEAILKAKENIDTVGVDKLRLAMDRANKINLEEPQPIGMGAATPGETAAPELAQLTTSLETLAATGKKPELKRAYTLSEQASQWKDSASKAIDGLKGVALYAKEKLKGIPKWDSFKNALGQRQLALTESALNARDFADKAQRAVPKAIDREAIADWIDAGGDSAKLNEALLTTKDQYKKGYEKALNLTPEEQTVAKNIQNYFESRLKDAQDAGIFEDGIEDYIHRIYEKDSPWKQGVLAELRSGVFTGKPALAKQRTFDYDFEAEQAGYKPIKDFAKRVAAYDLSLNKAIADRQFVKEAMQWKLPDGRPAIDAAGVGIPIEGAAGDAGPLLIKPQFKQGDTTNPKNNRSDYVALDHPALRKWKWVGEVAQDQPVLIQGNVLIHPDALPQIKAVFGQSKVRQNIVGRTALGLGATVKQTMLDLSGFHPVQITVHGWEHRTFKPVKEIDLQDPTQRALVSHGLVAADARGHEMFSEGLVGSSLTRHIPGLGPKLQAYNAWLFQDYIPRLKMAMATHALERNRERFKDELASGKMSEDQVLHMTAMQGNAAFGELNYEMMARNKTTQDMMRLALLAPDFLEARGRFAGQAFTKYGKEQRTALLLGAATLYITARIMNKLLDDQYHFEPKNAFSIVYDKHAYSLRTVQGDLLHAVTDPAHFAYNRLSPVYGRTGLEAITGRDSFGRSRTPLEQAKDLAKTIVPISLRGVVNPREQKLWQSFLNSIGITERRETATDDIFKLAQEFKKEIGSTEPGEFIYDPDKDPYRAIKIALAYDNPRTAAQEMLTLLRDGKVDMKKLEGFVNRFAKLPFTGSKKNDAAFVKQMSEDEKKTYQQALRERQNMQRNIQQALTILKHNQVGAVPRE